MLFVVGSSGNSSLRLHDLGHYIIYIYIHIYTYIYIYIYTYIIYIYISLLHRPPRYLLYPLFVHNILRSCISSLSVTIIGFLPCLLSSVFAMQARKLSTIARSTMITATAKTAVMNRGPLLAGLLFSTVLTKALLR